MGLSPWRNAATIQQATCDHVGTVSTAGNVTTCSACNNSWPSDGIAPQATVSRQVEYPPPT